MTPNIYDHREDSHFDIYDLVPSDVKSQAKQAVVDAQSAAAKGNRIASYLTDHWVTIAVSVFVGIVLADVVAHLIVKK